MHCKLCEMLTDQQQQHVTLLHQHQHGQQTSPQQLHAAANQFWFWPPQFPLRDLVLAYYLIRGYYQPAGPLISSHHHLHPAASAASAAPGKAPAVLPTLEASATPTPPPSAASHSVPPSQIVSSNSTPSGTTRGGDESSDNDVIITATSCSSGGGEVITQQQQQQQPPPAAYRYPAAYPPPAASTPHYAYPYTQHYPSPPASASVQYAPPHYHAQDLCYSGYAAAAAPPHYFNHKAYSTPPPPPAAYHRRYLVPSAPQYYTSELYPSAAPTASAPTPPQPNASSQSTPQATQQMVVAGGGSYLSAPREHAPPPLDSYPPPPPIVDPYPPPPGYYTGYGTGPGSAACYTHSPTPRGLAFIDSSYPSCPCPMQSCPKNVHTGPLTGDGKGPHLPNKQQQPLPPVVLALPLEPPGALGPPSPARGSAGISQPPTPATASVRNPNVMVEEDCTAFTWSSEAQLDKQEQLLHQEKPLAEDSAQITVVTSSEKDYSEVTTLPELMEEDMSQHRLLTIMKQPKLPACEKPISRRQSGDCVNGIKNVPLLMCDNKFQNRHSNASTTEEEVLGLVVRGDTDSVVLEGKPMEIDTSVTVSVNSATTDHDLNTAKVEASQKRKSEVGDSDKSEKVLLPAPKRQKCSKNKVACSVSQDQLSLKKENMFPKMISPAQDNAAKKATPLSSSNTTVVNVKPCPKKRKLEDTQDSCENAEPVIPPAKKKKLASKILKNPKDPKTKTYPSRAKQLKDKCSANSNSKDCDIINVNVLDDSLSRNRTFLNASTKKSNLPTVPVENGKIISNKVECKTKVNGSAVPQKKHTLRKSKQNGLPADIPTTPPVVSSGKARRKNSSVVDTNKVLNKPPSKKSNLLQSQQQRLESLSEEETEVIPKVLCVGGVRRPSLTASKKEQLKGQVRKTVKTNSEPTVEQQKSGVLSLCKKPPLKRCAAIAPKWSNGWSWNGEPFYAKVFLSSDDAPQMRKCYPSMRHIEGDIIYPRDCVLLKSGTRKIDLPFIAKVAALWENQDDGEMMVSLLWYYRPEHTDQGRREEHMDDEVFASKHKDTNSVACIEDKCYVLTFNEYCRFRKSQRRQEEGVREPALVVPQLEGYVRTSRQPPACVAPDMVFFCRKVYDFRQRRILKNPG